jgi:diguanylate cyclase (GGDEF)-like protein
METRHNKNFLTQIIYAMNIPSRGLSNDERQTLKQDGKPLILPEGACIFQRGEIGEQMYFIEQGQVEIQFEEGEPGRILESGESFGEIALLTGGSKRTASAYTTCETHLYVVEHATLDHLRRQHPEMLCCLFQRTCAYLVAHEDELISALKARNHELEQTLDYLRSTREELNASELRANTDALTGLYNRRCFDYQLPRFIARAKGEDEALALVLVDLDKFKPVNDTYGHAAGDTVLKSLAKILKKPVHNRDLPCRVGGDEFALLLHDIAQLPQRLRDLCRAVATTPIRVPPTSVTVTVSIGATQYRPNDTLESLMARADQSLYQSKGRGRNCVTWEGEAL